MALTNAQYDEIMRGYDKRQLQNKYIHDKRIEEAYRKAPRLREIDSEIASASVRQAYRLWTAMRMLLPLYALQSMTIRRSVLHCYPHSDIRLIILSLFTPVQIATIQDT